MAKIRVSKPKAVTPYSPEQIRRMLAICDFYYARGAKFLGSRNRAMILMFLYTGVRLSELTEMHMLDIDAESGKFKVLGKGHKERTVRLGKTARKALWRYLMHRPQNKSLELWLTEEGKPLTLSSVQSSDCHTATAKSTTVFQYC